MGRHFIGDLVALEDVGEGVDSEAKVLRDLHQHVDLGLDVGVTGNKPFFANDFEHGLMNEIATGRGRLCFLVFGKRVIGVHLFFVGQGVGKRVR